MLENLEEGGDYTISLNGLNNVGQGSSATNMTTTLFAGMFISYALSVIIMHHKCLTAAPTGVPLTVRARMTSSSTAQVQWNSVDCLERNGPIQMYIVNYGISESDEIQTVTTTSTSLTLTNLVGGQEYNVQVAAENSVGVGPFSEPVVLVFSGKQSIVALLIYSTTPVFTDITFILDPCASEANCDSNAVCITTPMGFECICNSGYTGNGVECNGEISLHVQWSLDYKTTPWDG